MNLLLKIKRAVTELGMKLECSYVIITIVLISIKTPTLAQSKPCLDTVDCNNWSSVSNLIASNNGKLVIYSVNYDLSSDLRRPKLKIKGIGDSMSFKFDGLRSSGDKAISDDSKKVLFVNQNDSLCILTVSDNSIEYIPNVGRFKLLKVGSTELLICQKTGPSKTVLFRSLNTKETHVFPNVVEYLIGDKGTAILRREIQEESTYVQMIEWIELLDFSSKSIWKGYKADNLVLNPKENKLAFKTYKNHSSSFSILCYSKSDNSVEGVISDTAKIFSRYELSGISFFSNSGKKLFIKINEKALPPVKEGAVKVDVWSYADQRLQSVQLANLRAESMAAMVDLTRKSSVCLIEGKDEKIISIYSDSISDPVFLISRQETGGALERWNMKHQTSFSLLIANTGDKFDLPKEINILPKFSTTGKYVYAQDDDRINIYLYEIATKQILNITKDLPIRIGDAGLDRPSRLKSRGLNVVEWIGEDEAVLIKDRFDIWQIDLKVINKPINLTNQFGRKNNIAFQLFEPSIKENLTGDENLILLAIDQNSFNSGFYRIALGQSKNPNYLSSGPYWYDIRAGVYQFKARDAERYFILREKSNESPNFYSTNDFKTFQEVSSELPEKKVNWLTSELITFSTLDGRKEKAVIYKPENFQPGKKYPAIVFYYEVLSDELNKFRIPGDSYGQLDIPWFVSRGYIVVTPDIHFNIGNPGESAFNSIVAVTKYLDRYPWINRNNIGIQGHSFGGYETNYVITHTNLFSAAMSSSGVSDMVSEYGSIEIPGGGLSHQNKYENDQSRIGCSLWERPDLYIKNSPVYNVHRVNTPLLMVSNKSDGRVPFTQGIEFFTSLRRLGKKSWMLQYDDGDHGLHDKKDKMDLLIRMNQFFDHYLKDSACPKWMLYSIPAKMKGIDDGLELVIEKDKNGNYITPGPGLLSPREQKKVDALKNRKSITIKLN